MKLRLVYANHKTKRRVVLCLEQTTVVTSGHSHAARSEAGYIRQDISLMSHVLLQNVQLAQDTTCRRMEACRLNSTNS